MAGPVRMRLRLHDRVLENVGRPLVMGVLNVTPDSFSDAGRFDTVEAAVRRAFGLLEEGADIVDVGGESTRPGSDPVAPDEESRRVLPVLDALMAARFPGPISIDTRRAPLAAEALRRGAHMVNDVTGLRDPAMADVVSRAGAPAVLMHMRGEPKTMQAGPAYDDVVAEVFAELEDARDRAEGRGIDRSQLVLDPGLGFGKRTGAGIEDNCDLLSGLPRLHGLGCPILVGASRKRFIGNLTGRPVEARLAGSLAATVAAAWGGAHIVRVHDVRPTVDALRVAAAIDPSAWGLRWRGSSPGG